MQYTVNVCSLHFIVVYSKVALNGRTPENNVLVTDHSRFTSYERSFIVSKSWRFLVRVFSCRKKPQTGGAGKTKEAVADAQRKGAAVRPLLCICI